jgi:hypothetical protein
MQTAPPVTTIRGHWLRINGSSGLPSSGERCAGCNTGHGTNCPGLTYCGPCGEAWCHKCLANEEKLTERLGCEGCHALEGPVTSDPICVESCNSAKQLQRHLKRNATKNVFLSWGSLAITTGDDMMCTQAEVVAGVYWGSGFLLPKKLICYRRYWGSADRDPAKRANLRILIGIPKLFGIGTEPSASMGPQPSDAPLVRINKTGKRSPSGPLPPGG